MSAVWQNTNFDGSMVKFSMAWWSLEEVQCMKLTSFMLKQHADMFQLD